MQFAVRHVRPRHRRGRDIEELEDLIRIAARLGVDKVQFWHMNRWSEAEMARYFIEKDG
jgi:hypothetical protein